MAVRRSCGSRSTPRPYSLQSDRSPATRTTDRRIAAPRVSRFVYGRRLRCRLFHSEVRLRMEFSTNSLRDGRQPASLTLARSLDFMSTAMKPADGVDPASDLQVLKQ